VQPLSDQSSPITCLEEQITSSKLVSTSPASAVSGDLYALPAVEIDLAEALTRGGPPQRITDRKGTLDAAATARLRT
jgi:hypothetical protein